MSSLYVLIPLGAMFTAIAVGFFWFSIRSGQFDELDEWSQRMPDDEE